RLAITKVHHDKQPRVIDRGHSDLATGSLRSQRTDRRGRRRLALTDDPVTDSLLGRGVVIHPGLGVLDHLATLIAPLDDQGLPMVSRPRLLELVENHGDELTLVVL